MKKTIVFAALLGSVYFANAQVGIGTPEPAVSAELEIFAKDKGILIPRVELKDINDTNTIQGDEVESLLVYNKTAVTGSIDKGFYFWDGAKWSKIINDTHLQEVVNNLGDDVTIIEGDITKIKEVINYILPSNPENKDDQGQIGVDPGHTTIVYNPLTHTMQYVVYENNKYTTKDINLKEFIKEGETNTVVVEVKKDNKTTGYKFFNEEAVKAFLLANPGKTEKDITEDTAGGILVDVVGGVVNNIAEILEHNVSITEGGKTFTKVVEYLQYKTQFSEGNVIFKNLGDTTTPNRVFQYWDGTSYETIDLDDLVKGTETRTQIKRGEVTDATQAVVYTEVRTEPAVGTIKKGEVYYEYAAEGGQKDYLNISEDVLYALTNHDEIKNQVQNILNNGGNVYFGDHDKDATTDEAFYKIVKDSTGKDQNEKIELPASFLLEIINKYKDVIKQNLGDHITDLGDVIFTGNTIDGKMVYLTKSVVKTNPNSAKTEGVTIAQATGDKAIDSVVSIKLLKNGNVVSSSVRDVTVTGTKIDFNMGVGNIYTVLPADTYEVIVEYIATK